MGNNHIVKIWGPYPDLKHLEIDIQKEIDCLKIKNFYPYLVSSSSEGTIIIFEGP